MVTRSGIRVRLSVGGGGGRPLMFHDPGRIINQSILNVADRIRIRFMVSSGGILIEEETLYPISIIDISIGLSV